MVLADLDLKKILKDYDLVSASDLAQADSEAESKNLPLAQVLVDKALITDNHLGQILADYWQVPYINLAMAAISDEALKLVPEAVARKQLVICFETTKDQVKLAVTDPRNLEVVHFLEKKLGKPVRIFLASTRDLKNSLRRYHQNLTAEFDGLIKNYLSQLERNQPSVETDPPVIKIIDTILEFAYYQRASDVHIEPQLKDTVVRYRIDGLLQDVLTLPKAVHDYLVTRVKILAELKTDEHFAAQDGKFFFTRDDDRIDVRVSVAPITEGEKVVLRLLTSNSRQFNLEDLGFEAKDLEALTAAAEKPHGMILACGPTGSGKTTTLYSILKIINNRDINIATIEDPVEYEVPGISQIQVNPRTNLTYAAGLKSLLRQDPDVIMVGEIRDNETAGLGINAALTGHLVLSSLHTNDAATTLPRLLDMEVESFLIASTVNLIISQRLVRKICQNCIVSYTLSATELKKLEKQIKLENYLPLKKSATRLYKGRGCPVCLNRGFKGRVGIFEILVIEDSLRKLIMDRANAAQIKAQAIANGMVPMIVSGLKKALMGETTIEEVLRVAGD